MTSGWEKGEVVTVPNKVDPEKKSILLMLASGFVVLAASVPEKGAANVAPLAGVVIAILGGMGVGLLLAVPGRVTCAPGMGVPVPLGSPSSWPLEKPSPSVSVVAKSGVQVRPALRNALPKGLREGTAVWHVAQLLTLALGTRLIKDDLAERFDTAIRDANPITIMRGGTLCFFICVTSQ